MIWIVCAPLAAAAHTPPVQIFFLPLPEDQIRTSLYAISTATGMTMHSITGISITGNGTVIYYDQWENGYELDIANPTQANTQIWGDGDAANGCPPNLNGAPLACTDGNDALVAGNVIILENDVALPRNPATVRYDGRDKVGATKAIAVTRSAWATAPGTVLADAVEAYDTTRWGTSFRLPVGQNLSSSSMFEYASLLVMASQDGTVVQIDKDGNGTVDDTQTLNQGQAYQISGGMSSNATVAASAAVQVNLITGDIGSTYESRWFSIPPTDQWGASYYTPVGTTVTTYPANVWVYNPDQTNAITVNYQTKAGSGSFSVAAKGTHRYEMPLQSGAHFWTSGANFLAVGTMDSSTTGADQTFDWGYTLVPDTWLTTAFVVGWAPGTGDSPISGNGSPVWVTAVRPTTIYVKYDGNVTSGGAGTAPNGLTYDVAYALSSFESRQIYDPDKNQTGMRVYTADGTLITGTWGEDPAKASAGTPYLDVGYTIPPLPQVVVSKAAGLLWDVDGNGQADPGDTLAYTITVKNTGAVTLFGTVVSETLPVNTGYVTDSATLNGAPVTDGVVTRFPLDEGGINVGTLIVGNSAVITYGLKLDEFPPVYSAITNTAEVLTSEGLFQVTVVTPVNVGTITACTLDFTDPGGAPVSFYLQNGTVYVQVADADQNTADSSVQTISAQVRDTTTGDYETVVLTETGINTGIFAGSLPSSITDGQTPDDGTLYARAGETLEAAYSDTIFAPDTCSANAMITTPSETKVLYLSDPGQALDRMDPVATGDGTTAYTAVLAPSSGTIAVDAISTGQREGVFSSMTVAHTTGTGQNRLMLVGISLEADSSSAITVTSISYAGQSLTRVRSQSQSEARSEMWRLVNPPAGAGTVQVNVSNAAAEDGVIVGVATFTGVDQTTPLGAAVSSTGDSTSPSISVPSATGELVLANLAADDGRTATNAGGQTSRWNLRTETGADGVRGAGSTKAGATSTTLSWTLDVGDWWTVVAAPIKPAPSVVPSTTFTQTPAMAADFAMPAGGAITVTTYISGSLGSDGTKAITATLRYGGAAFATLTSGTYNSAAGTLVWTGGLGSNTTVPAGQAISLTVTSGVTNTFQIRYDSATYPSKIQLPTTTVIDLTSLGVYDAAYPDGVALTGATNGQTVYVRVTASDPFGPSDVVSTTLALAGPLGTTNVTLTDTDVVATAGATKTYEYPWATPAASGAYTITATSYEGYEGITDSASTPFNLNFQDTGTPCALDFVTASGVPTTTFSLGGRVYLRCGDVDQNANAGVAETITVTLTTSNGDSETLTLTETSVDTGVFAGDITSSNTGTPTQGNSNLEAPAGTTINAEYRDPDSPSDICTDSAMISAVTPAMSIAKTRVEPGDGVAVVGELVRFDVTVGNPGPTTLVTATLTDTFPSGCLAYQSASVTPSSVVTPTLVWSNLGPIPSGGSTTVSLYFVATAACNPATNSASGNAIDQNSVAVAAGPATASVVTTRPQLALSKALVSPPSGVAVVGDTVTFQIHITNTGSTTITTLPLQDDYSAACIEYQSATPAASGAGGGIALWDNLGPLAAGDATSVTVLFHVEGPCSPTVNTAAANNAYDVNGDPVPPVQDSASLTTTAQPPQIALLKTLTAPASGTAYMGDAITYTVYISNTGPNAITSLALTDTYNSACQTAVSYGEITPTQTGAGLAVWNTLIPPQPPLLPGQAFSLTLGFQALAPNASCTNTVTSAGLDRYGQPVGPLDSQTSVIVSDRPLIGAAKALVGDVASIGGGRYVITYTLQVQNYGDGVLSSVQVTDDLSSAFPSPVTFAVNSVTASAGLTPNATYNGTNDLNLLTGTNSLAVGASGSITFTLTITPGLAGPGPFNNQAQARGTGALSTIAYDQSQNGADPDPDSNNDPTDNNAPTPLTLAQIYGHIFVDTDGGGTQNGLEPNLSGISVVITDSQGVTRTVTTDASGNYTATVPAGNTTADVVEATLPAGYVQTAGADPSSVTVPAGSVTNIGADGYQPQGTLIVDVFNDANGNGAHDPGEGLPGVEVLITPSVGAPFTVTTDASGLYTATVPAGATWVDVNDIQLPPGAMQTTGSDPSMALVPPGGSANDINGYQMMATIGGGVYDDRNADGQRDSGEPGLAGVIITINTGITTTTDAHGLYTFTVPVGTYTITETNPANYLSTAALTGTVGSQVINPDTFRVSVGVGQSSLENDFLDSQDTVGRVTIAKTPDLQQVQTGGTVTFTIQVTNTGAAALTAVTVSDPLAPACGHTIGNLTISATISYTCTLANVTAGFTNTATVTGAPPVGSVVTASDTAVVQRIAPAIAIAKTPDVQYVRSGDTVTFTIQVTNTGDVALTGVAVSDPLAPDCGRTIGSLAVGATSSYTCARSGVTLDFTNVATVTGQPPVGPAVTRADSAAVDVVAPAIAIAKTPDLQQVGASTLVTFTIQVTNTGDARLNNITVGDTLAPNCARSLGFLIPGATVSYTCHMTPTTTVTNIATTTGIPADTNGVPLPGIPAPTAQDDAVVQVLTAGIDLVKTAGSAPDGQTLTLTQAAPVSVTYTYRVTNTGTSYLKNVTVTDDKIGAICAPALLAPGLSTTCVVTATVAADVTNTGAATGAPANAAGVTLPGLANPTDTDQARVEFRGSIGDFVWWDLDRDGVQDAGEPGIPNVALVLTTSSGLTVTAGTDASGVYTFTSLPAGAYTVALQAAQFQPGGALADWYPTVPTPALITTSLAAGQALTTTDFGLNIPTGYTLTKVANTAPPIRTGDPISYTIRVTNTGKTTLTVLPMTDIYDTAYLSYGYHSRFANPPSQDNLDDGQIDWPDLVASFGQTLAPNAGCSLVVTFTAIGDTNALPNQTISNTVEAHDAIAEAMGLSVPAPPRVRLPAAQDATPVKIDAPTGLDVTGIRLARADGNTAVLTWSTANESQILGFNIVRDDGRGQRQTVSPEIIAAELAGTAQGTTYRYADRGLPAGTYTYTLEVIRLTGQVARQPAGQLKLP